MSTSDDQPKYPTGTLIDDMGKIGVISKILLSGALETDLSIIKWRVNYEI